jgi:hypothetical protein
MVKKVQYLQKQCNGLTQDSVLLYVKDIQHIPHSSAFYQNYAAPISGKDHAL